MRIVWLRQAIIACLCCLLCAVGMLQAQNVRLRGQIFLPTGQPIGAVTRFLLSSEDTRRRVEIHFTDSQGRFFLQGLSAGQWFTITVESDGETYATTRESFLPAGTTYVPIHLRPLEEPKALPRQPSVSVSQLAHKPPKEARKAYEQAIEEIKNQRIERAKEKLRQALKLDPAFVNAYNELAVLAIGAAQYKEAESLLRMALEKDAVALHPLLNLGITLNHQGRYAEAIEPLEHALKLRPAWLSPAAYLGVALLETGRLDEAQIHLERGTRSDGFEQALSFLYLGKLYAQRGDADKAVIAWQSYLERDPDSPNAARVRELLEKLRPANPKP